MSQELYEEFHKNTRMTTKIVKDNDFELIHHLSIYRKYIQKGNKVLDVGCGAAPMSLYFASKGVRVKGIDLSQRAIAENLKAKEYFKFDNLEFSCEDFMEYADYATYDVVMMTEVLEHLPDDKGSLQKINKLLKDDGYLLMSVPSSNAPLHKKYVKKYGKDPFDERVGHLRRYNAVQIFNLLYETGFELVEFKLCEGYFRNWLYNDNIGHFFMKFNRLFVHNIVTFLDDNFFTPIFGESDIIIVAKKKS
jgi:SAM-dependent methyltransferase